MSELKLEFFNRDGEIWTKLHAIPHLAKDQFGRWYFNDETENCNGPFPTLEEAVTELDRYNEHFLGK